MSGIGALIAAALAVAAAKIRSTSTAEKHAAPTHVIGVDAVTLARLLADERTHTAEAVIDHVRARYGDRFASIERHFARVEEAILGATVTGRDGIARRVEAIEETLDDMRDRPRTRPGD